MSTELLQSVEQQNIRFYQRAHRLALGSSVLHLLVCAGFATASGTWWLVALVGLPSVLVPAWLAMAHPERLVSRMAVAVGMMFQTALIIQQTGGDMEAHFSFFVMMSILLVYCDWRTVVLAYATIATHHLVFTVLQPMGLGFRVWGDTRGDWGHLLVHAAVGAFQAGALSYLSVMLHNLVQGSFQVNGMAQAISEGQLEIQGPAQARGEMIQSMLTMRDRLAAMMARVQGAAHSLGAALQEISSGSDDLASRTEASASRTQSTTAEIVSFVDSARRTLEVTDHAESTSRDVAAAVETMSSAANELLTTMGAIDTNSKRVAEIIGVIDGIAFQTNILALNAAVEAARAGEQGRGFAVVASEVRSLAQRSAQAAREVRELIQAAVASAADGSRLAGSTGEALSRTESLIGRVQSLVKEAAEATRDGQPRLEALSRSLQEIDGAMQQNAAFVEELSATTLALRDQEVGLREAVAAFRAGSAVRA